MLNRAVVRDGKPYPPATLAELEIVAEAPASLARLKDARLPAAGGHQPARRRPRHADPRDDRGDHRAPARELCRWTTFWSAPTTTAMAATAASRSPGCCSRRRRAYGIDLRRSVPGRRPLARHRCRARRRLPDRSHRPRLSRTRPRAAPDARVASLPEAVDWILTATTGESHDECQLDDLKIKLFADGADKAAMLELYANPLSRASPPIPP